MKQKILNVRNRIQSTYIKVALFGIVFISLVVTVSIKNYTDFRDALIVREQKQMLTLAESIARTLSDFVSNKTEDARILKRMIIEQIRENSNVDYQSEIFAPVLKNYLDVQKGDVFMAEWIDAKGRSLEYFVDSRYDTAELEELYELNNPVLNGQSYIGDVIQTKDNNMYLDIVEVVQFEGETLGYIRFVISLEYLYNEYVKDFRAGDNGYASLKNADGILIMHPSKDGIGEDVLIARRVAYPDYDWSELEDIVDIQKKGQPGVGIYHSIWSHDEKKERVKKFNGYYPAQIGDSFWIVNVSMDYKELVNIVNKHLYTSMVMIGAVPLLFIIMTIYVLNLKRNLDQLQIEHNYVEQLNLLNKELEEDIEQRKNLEYKLKQSQRRFRTLFNVSVDLTFVMERSESGIMTITDVNNTACERIGKSREELTGAHFFDLDESLNTIEATKLSDLLYQNKAVQYETQLTLANGQALPVEINGQLFEFQDKVYVMLIARDIKERLHQIEEVERHRALAIYKDRMAAVGEMVANIAHQWRQPLSSLNLMLSNIEDAYEMGDLDQDYFNTQIDKSRNVIQKMSVIIDEFRYFFKPDDTEREFEVGDSVRQVIDMLNDRLRIESVKVMADEVESNIKVKGHSNQLAQVLLNIVGNALDAFRDQQENEQKQVEIISNIEDGKVKLLINDNAGGIDQSNLSKLFEPYYTTKAGQGGTGIGLYMSKMIIESKFSGEIRVNKIANGLQFEIIIPSINS